MLTYSSNLYNQNINIFSDERKKVEKISSEELELVMKNHGANVCIHCANVHVSLDPFNLNEPFCDEALTIQARNNFIRNPENKQKYEALQELKIQFIEKLHEANIHYSNLEYGKFYKTNVCRHHPSIEEGREILILYKALENLDNEITVLAQKNENQIQLPLENTVEQQLPENQLIMEIEDNEQEKIISRIEKSEKKIEEQHEIIRRVPELLEETILPNLKFLSKQERQEFEEKINTQIQGVNKTIDTVKKEITEIKQEFTGLRNQFKETNTFLMKLKQTVDRHDRQISEEIGSIREEEGRKYRAQQEKK
jgi:hypothetical protein